MIENNEQMMVKVVYREVVDPSHLWDIQIFVANLSSLSLLGGGA